jgi:hypothetical protein
VGSLGVGGGGGGKGDDCERVAADEGSHGRANLFVLGWQELLQRAGPNDETDTA